MKVYFYYVSILIGLGAVGTNSSILKNMETLKHCISCLCEAASMCDENAQCNGHICGPFQISEGYWMESGMPNMTFLTSKEEKSRGAFYNCVTNIFCGMASVIRYMERFQIDSNGDGKIDCDDFALIHLYGPNGSVGKSLLKSSQLLFVQRYLKCNGVNSRLFRDKIVTRSCMDCLCVAASGCVKATTECNGGNCGPFQISEPYWQDSGSPIALSSYSHDLNYPQSYHNCVKDMKCSMGAVENYMQRYKRDSNRDGKIDCDDFALIQLYGPDGSVGQTLSPNSPSPFIERYLKCRSK